ncbi:hypothetical protein BC937DRAFT_86506 [Endogone sp. FLAS-F59071]|nr:hypothetical protein BC937DRAFT_86506 [Endogone sp. FLAS-F59071]|eukprot:RUS20045.1 hypothetical protein BC937DRAFT_86506 [Endogone sp. FLAS-F59071]
MLIRNAGARWLMTVQLALVVKLLDHYEVIAANEITDQVRHDAAVHEALLAQAAAYGISECYTWKYLIDVSNGKSVSRILGIKPGPTIGEILPEVMRWQLAHPEGTVEECGKFIKKMWSEKATGVKG